MPASHTASPEPRPYRLDERATSPVDRPGRSRTRVGRSPSLELAEVDASELVIYRAEVSRRRTMAGR
jgi:hypothetical protein